MGAGRAPEPPTAARQLLRARPSPRAPPRPAPLAPLKCPARASRRRTFTLQRRVRSASLLSQPAAPRCHECQGRRRAGHRAGRAVPQRR